MADVELEQPIKIAAMIAMCTATGRALMVRRHNDTAWLFPTAALEDDETPEEAAARAFSEATGTQLGSAGKPLTRRVRDGADLTTFTVIVPQEFTPKLDPDYDNYCWIDPVRALAAHEQAEGVAA